MGTHLYICENGGPFTVGIVGTPPIWVTCPVCAETVDCSSCLGAQLRGEAPDFPVVTKVLYRCAEGHERTLLFGADAAPAESAHCPDCDGMLLPAPAA